MALVDNYSSIIFDFGGVLVHHQSNADQAKMAAVLQVAPETFRELYWSRRGEYDQGELTGYAYWQDIAARAGSALSSSLAEELTALDAESWMQFDEVMWEWVRELREGGKRLAILSNMPGDLGAALKREQDRLAMLDEVTLSYEVALIKPEPGIYQHCLSGLGARASEAIFFDDRLENVEGAERVGIRAVQFLDRDKILAEARSKVRNSPR